ncbi:hypothetical protein EDB81DRAFT_799265 [Dactylonectria macrodidyma]|uniref:NB-ARC domain-containing protein n=1 Tax=Dactylonectria macrodidyma TaxID=307937 RepID=A0A9P9EPY3_9HYPO|nr:hypothetical protein EDB81DRAFT_799265 [Dactylonectria macrodidyma]
MAEAVGLAASVIAIIELSAKVGTLCLEYSTAVSNARSDIARLRSRLDDLGRVVRGLQKLLGSPDAHTLTTSRELLDCVDNCTLELGQLQSKLDPSRTRKTMRRFGFRALKWPFDTKEINQILSNFERYERTITLSLQVDQTTLLLDIGQRIKDISRQPGRDTPVTCKPCFSMPFQPDPDFIDRPEILTWMKEHYTDPSGRMALLGMGGFGKSQLAIQFAHEIHTISPRTSIFWVYASSKQRFQEAYRSIADQLQLPRRNDPEVDLLGIVRDWCQREEVGPWLMVLDNVDDVNVFYPSHAADADKTSHDPSDASFVEVSLKQPLASFLPKRHNGVILVTSRSLDAAERLTGSHKSIHKVSPMDGAQALQLLQHKLDVDFDEDDAAGLLQALDHIPLAITQAAAYINRRAPRMSVATYLDDFRKSDKKKGNLLNCDAGDLRRDETVSNSVVTTWQVTFEQIQRERPSAAYLLSFMSFFNPQGIPEFAIRHYQKDVPRHADIVNKENTVDEGRSNEQSASDNEDTSDQEDTEFEDDLDVLRGYSLVSTTADRDIFEMHSLVQFCTRIWLSAVDQAREWERAYLWVISRRFPNRDFKTWPTCRALMPHVESIIHKRSENELQPWVDLLTNCGQYLYDIGNFAAAEKLARKTLETNTSMLGEEHPRTLINKRHLASTIWRQGRWKEAEKLEVRLVELQKKIQGDEHPDTLTSISNLALTYSDQGRWKEAEDLQEKELNICLKVMGEEHPDTLISMSNLASTYNNQGRWKEAEDLQEKELKICLKVMGEEHPDTLVTKGNLAVVWKNMGRLNDAIILMKDCISARRKILGPDHPKTQNSVRCLGEWTRET